MTFLKQYNNANGLCLLITIYILENITDLQKKNVYFPPKKLLIQYQKFLADGRYNILIKDSNEIDLMAGIITIKTRGYFL
jgi:hypothetical protein